MVFLSTTIATSYPGILGKITMSSSQIQYLCSQVVDDIIDRMHVLCSEGKSEDAKALYSEIRDWIVKKNDIDVLSLQYLDED